MATEEPEKMAEESEEAVQRAREIFMEIKRIEATEEEILGDTGTDKAGDLD